MAGGLVASLEAVLLMTALGLARHLTPFSTASATTVLCLLHLMAAYGQRGPRPRAGAGRLSLPLKLAAAAASSAVAFRLFLASALPIDSWDALTYHVPIIWRWVQQGNLDLAGWSGQQRYNPWNGELIPAWLALLDGGSLDAVRTSQAFALLWLSCAAAAIGRRLGGLSWGPAAAAALLALPIGLIHAGLPYVDLFYAAYWAAAAAAALAWHRTGKPVHLALWGLGFGLALGSKATIYFQAPLLVPIGLTVLSRPQRRAQLLGALPAAAALALAGGSFCYFRAWIQHGSPVYPFVFKLAGRTVFHGILEPQELLVTVERWFVESRAGWLSYPFHETMKGDIAYSSENGFGAVFAAGWVLFPAACARALWRRDWGAAGFLALLPATVFFFLTLHPTREPRYVIFLAPVVIGGLCFALSRLRGAARAAAFWAWSLGVCWSVAGVLAFYGADPAALDAWRRLRGGGKVDPMAYYRAQFGALGQLWTALDVVLGKDDVVVVNYGELQLPLAGVPARARVRVVGHSAGDFPESLWAVSDEDWLDLLDSLKTRFLVVWTPPWYPDVGQPERASIAKFPERFRRAGRWEVGMGAAELYELLPKAAPTPK